jgi:hypothetical protein
MVNNGDGQCIKVTSMKCRANDAGKNIVTSDGGAGKPLRDGHILAQTDWTANACAGYTMCAMVDQLGRE